ncbi:hypothetical protein NDU88_002962 [Pleurodeles waltl]|uniref:Uncharacterized protein n=1 Tax=Pleurodeles waltl TaxID=8319 RepID=A0AAV7SC22_PLEWA|nr:hypothetical protein NDU88_002962 [Pleurodeles waltl]
MRGRGISARSSLRCIWSWQRHSWDAMALTWGREGATSSAAFLKTTSCTAAHFNAPACAVHPRAELPVPCQRSDSPAASRGFLTPPCDPGSAASRSPFHCRESRARFRVTSSRYQPTFWRGWKLFCSERYRGESSVEKPTERRVRGKQGLGGTPPGREESRPTLFDHPLPTSLKGEHRSL